MLHTHVCTRVQPGCPAWRLKKPFLKFKSRIFVGSNTVTEISHVLIQVWIFLRVWDPTILFLWHEWISGTFPHSPEKSAGFSMEWEPHMGCCAGGSITARSNPGEQETPFPYCFQKGCVFFLLDFIPFPPPFFAHSAQQWLMLLTLCSE